MAQWSFEFDFSMADGGWIRRATSSANYNFGTGWSYGDRVDSNVARRQVDIIRTFSSSKVKSIQFIFDLSKGAVDSTNTVCLLINDSENVGDTTLLKAQNFSATASGANQTFAWLDGVGVQMAAIRLLVNISRDSSVPYSYSGSGLIRAAVVTGVGINPFVPFIELENSTQAPDQTAYIYRAPITGNPSEEDLTVNNDSRPIRIDVYAIDPINRHL